MVLPRGSYGTSCRPDAFTTGSLAPLQGRGGCPVSCPLIPKQASPWQETEESARKGDPHTHTPASLPLAPLARQRPPPAASPAPPPSPSAAPSSDTGGWLEAWEGVGYLCCAGTRRSPWRSPGCSSPRFPHRNPTQCPSCSAALCWKGGPGRGAAVRPKAVLPPPSGFPAPSLSLAAPPPPLRLLLHHLLFLLLSPGTTRGQVWG